MTTAGREEWGSERSELGVAPATKRPSTRSARAGRRRRPTKSLVLAIAVLCATASVAAADGLRVGLFAPSTPFEGTGARLEFATKLAKHIGGDDAVGRVYGKASDFASALRKGDIDLASCEEDCETARRCVQTPTSTSAPTTTRSVWARSISPVVGEIARQQ